MAPARTPYTTRNDGMQCIFMFYKHSHSFLAQNVFGISLSFSLLLARWILATVRSLWQPIASGLPFRVHIKWRGATTTVSNFKFSNIDAPHTPSYGTYAHSPWIHQVCVWHVQHGISCISFTNKYSKVTVDWIKNKCFIFVIIRRWSFIQIKNKIRFTEIATSKTIFLI